MTDDDSKKLAATLLGLIGVFGYGLLTLIAIREEFIHDVDRQEMQTAKQWPPVSGEIGEFSIAPVYVPDGRMHGHDEYKVRVRYKYVVGNRSYFGQQDKFLDYPNKLGIVPPADYGSPTFLTYTKETEQKMASDYCAGTGHVVRYNPVHPEISFVDIRVDPEDDIDLKRRMIIFGALSLGVVISWVVSSGALKMR